MASNPLPAPPEPDAPLPVETGHAARIAPPIPIQSPPNRRGVLRSLGLGMITGAADDNPSAIGTYASAGAAFGPALLWTIPLILPMMFTVVYLSGKVGQVTRQGLFTIIRQHFSSKILYFLLVTALIGNCIEAGADLGGMAAALNLFVPIPIPWLVALLACLILGLQIWTSYQTIRNIFRWLALALLAYVASAILAHPNWHEALRGTLIPKIHFSKEYFAMLVAVVGASLSAYIYSWQSNLEVEEHMVTRPAVERRRTISRHEMKVAARDTALGMLFAVVIVYFLILSTAATLHDTGKTDISTAADAAQALRPIAGRAASLLFAVGVVAAGFLAVPIMTAGAAYDLCQTFGWKHGLRWKGTEAKAFYAAIVGVTAVAVGMNFLRVNPMKALVYAGIVQGVSTPFLTLTVVLINNNREIMGGWVNGRPMNILGWITTAAMFLASIGLCSRGYCDRSYCFF